MKRTKYHTLQTWILLICFIAGQYMVYAHRHGGEVSFSRSARHYSNPQPKQTVTENCRLCDAMHHNTMATTSPAWFAPVLVTGYFYKIFHYQIISIKLVRSAGRSPPIA